MDEDEFPSLNIEKHKEIELIPGARLKELDHIPEFGSYPGIELPAESAVEPVAVKYRLH